MEFGQTMPWGVPPTVRLEKREGLPPQVEAAFRFLEGYVRSKEAESVMPTGKGFDSPAQGWEVVRGEKLLPAEEAVRKHALGALSQYFLGEMWLSKGETGQDSVEVDRGAGLKRRLGP